MSVNVEIIEKIISEYKKNFTQIANEEIYKWEAVEWFQSRWDIDAIDFSSMLSDALSKAYNLLAAQNFFPKRMLLYFTEKDPEAVKAMLKDLFDESKDLIERIDSFIAASDDLLFKYGEGTMKMHYQTSNSISVYLFFRYPDKYYIYKARKFKKFAVKVGYTNIPKQGDTEGVRAYFDMCEEVHKYVRNDTELCEISGNRLKDNHYADSKYHILTEDIIFYGSRMEEQEVEWWPSKETYDPNITTEQWISLLKDREIFTNDSLAIMKRLLHYGGEATCTELSKNYGKNFNFYNNVSSALGKRIWKETNCPTVLKEDSGSSKWWPILYRGKKADKTVEGRYIWRLRPELKEALSHVDLSHIPLYANQAPDTKQYWWLNANPKIWSFSGIRVGEEQWYTLYNENGNKRKIFQNFLDVKKDDYIIGYESSPVKQVVALGKISNENDGEKIFFEKTETLSNPIDYSLLKEIPELQNMEYFVSPQGSLFKLTKEEFETILDLIREQNPIAKSEELQPYTKEDFLSSVYIDESQYDTLVSLLERKKNVILQGAPGVGKTYAAKRLAYSIIGNKNDEQIELIQFHQNYSYEDFIMGYKPNGDGFELKNGVFYRFCQKAENNPDKPYFFIIDEINRGNLSKIFGELLMLIEKDYRGTKTTLAYNGLPFAVPENVYIIGMMNTADRSLAMIDYALRRRFSFFDMVPAFYSEGFRAYQKSLNNEVFDDLIAQIKLLNQEIVKDPSLGDGFCIGHSYFCGQSVCTDSWIAEVIEYDLLPMLREYWFDDTAKVQKWEMNLRGVLND